MSIESILVVDDDTGVLSALEEMLTDDGYAVTAVESGEAALSCIAVQEYDLALLDLRMRGIGGMEVLAALRQQSPDTIAIVLTAHASLDTAVEALRQGAHDYLLKPCRPSELRESIRTGLLRRRQERKQRELLGELEYNLMLLREMRASGVEQATYPRPVPGSKGEGERFLQHGGVIMDLTRHLVTLDGYPLELTPIEFGFLTYLVREAPRVVSPQELVREVQGYECEPWGAANIARSHICRMRRKMKAATGHADVIWTVRGVGYTVGGQEHVSGP